MRVRFPPPVLLYVVREFAEIFDVGPVVYPAFNATVVDARAIDMAKTVRSRPKRDRPSRRVEQRPVCRRAAVHEAGHAVVGYIEGGRVRAVEVFSNGGGSTRWWERGGSNRLAVCLAGIAAELEAGITREPRDWWWPDPAWRSDLKNAERAFARWRSSCYSARHRSFWQTVELGVAEQRRALRCVWPSVEGLAEAIRQSGCLDGRAAYREIERALRRAA